MFPDFIDHARRETYRQIEVLYSVEIMLNHELGDVSRVGRYITVYEQTQGSTELSVLF